MSFVNYTTKEINCKIVYYGPGLGGKTTNLQYLYHRTSSDARGRLISLATNTERTLFFDFLPLALGTIRGFRVRFHLYTVPGQVFYDASRRLILKGSDGVVFVADSQVQRMEANLESLKNLEYHLQQQGDSFATVPVIFQYNKRDLPNVSPVSEMSKRLNRFALPEFEAIAIRGLGVVETLKGVAKRVLLQMKTATYTVDEPSLTS